MKFDFKHKLFLILNNPDSYSEKGSHCIKIKNLIHKRNFFTKTDILKSIIGNFWDNFCIKSLELIRY